MNSTRRLFFPLLLLVTVVTTPAHTMQLTWATDDTPGDPYIIGGGTTFNEDRPGIEIEVYRLVAEKLGLEVQFRRIPWALALELLAHNKVDGLFPACFKPERMSIGVYPMSNGKPDPSRKTRDNGYYLYKLKTSPIDWTGTEFRNVDGAIGVPIDWAVVDDLRRLDVEIKELPLHADSPGLLVRKRLAGFVCLETVMDGYISKQPERYRDIVKVRPPIWVKPYYLMLSHRFVSAHPQLAESIWKTIAEIKRSTEYKLILNKYRDLH